MHECKQESRISRLEGDIRVNNTGLNNLATKIDNLTGELKWLVRLIVLTLLAIAGFFIKGELGG